MDCTTEETDVPGTASVSSAYMYILQNNVDERGVFYDGALFISRLRSNLKIPLSTVNNITAGCSYMQLLLYSRMCSYLLMSIIYLQTAFRV